MLSVVLLEAVGLKGIERVLAVLTYRFFACVAHHSSRILVWDLKELILRVYASSLWTSLGTSKGLWLLLRLAGDTVVIGEAIELIGVADFRAALTDALLVYLALLD